MFKTITNYHYTSNFKIRKQVYRYCLVDSDFECEIEAVANANFSIVAAASMANEYHKRKLDVVRNIYLFNIFFQKEWYPDSTFMEILNCQNDCIDKYCPIDGLSFSKDIYPKVKELYEKLNLFK